MMVNQSSHSPLTKSILKKIYHGKLIRKVFKIRIATSDQEPAKIRRQPEPVFQRLHRFLNPLKFKLVGNVYQKTVAENQLEVNLENECEFLNKISPKEFMSLDLSR